MPTLSVAGPTFLTDKRKVTTTGEFSQQASDLLSRTGEFTKAAVVGDDYWTDILVDIHTGQLYAVYVAGQGTPFYSEVQYVELSREDVPEAWEAAQSGTTS